MTTAPLTITPKTTVHSLLKEYPFLLDYLAEYHPEFKKLTNPVLRKTVGRMATLDAVAQQADVPLNRLTDDIATEIEKQTGTRPPIADVADAQTIDPARLEALHAIVKDLHAGKSVEEVKPRFEELIADVEATEIAAMEQKLIEGGVPDSEVKRLCDVHVQVFADALEGHEAVTRAGRPPHGHVPAREPGAAPGDGVPAQGRRGRSASRRTAPRGGVSREPWATPWSGSPRSTSTTCARRTSSSPSSRTTAWKDPARSCGRSTTTSAR